jgi:hypothetical protein
LFISTHFAPVFIVIIVYGIIYYRVIQSSTTVRHSTHITRRDLELIKYILILFIIFILSGVPTLIISIVMATREVRSRVVYLFPVVSAPFVGIIEKIFLYLNKEIRKETKKLLSQLHLIRRSNYVTVIPSSATRAANIAVH